MSSFLQNLAPKHSVSIIIIARFPFLKYAIFLCCWTEKHLWINVYEIQQNTYSIIIQYNSHIMTCMPKIDAMKGLEHQTVGKKSKNNVTSHVKKTDTEPLQEDLEDVTKLPAEDLPEPVGVPC